MISDKDPIVAIATAPGRGGIGIVRLSGADLAPVIEAVLGARARALAPRRATFARFLDAAGEAIDEGIALLFAAPHSYTGETVLELQAHGGPVVLRLLLARCLEAGRAIGLRLAEPGEFTRRAFLNDRLDLAQAEAVADLIDASTAAAARSATRSLAGAFSREVQALADALVELRTLIEATLDFPEEEIDFLEASDARGRLSAIRARLAQLLARARQGAVLREGLAVVLIGQPNVGKSSLLNALAGEELAIVTPVAGTTRDRIAQQVEVEGIPLNVIDTAGLRETTDPVERIGIERTWAEVERADVVLHLVDAAARETAAEAADAAIEARVRERAPRAPVLTVFNKVDLTDAPARAEGDSIWLSALTGAGLDALRARLLAIAGWESPAAGEHAFLARTRHLEALRAAQRHLDAAAAHAEQGDRQLELLAEELRLAGDRLGEITGEVTADELLGRIFSRFCIGK
ncbi:MAG: tRNA uridine-5-carboxymethylaminomethyl(34) synthesis GTPase MnmE [Burkholderiaceae bacterium]